MTTTSWKLSLVPAAALALLPALSGCDEIECGDGTVEVDGVCEVDVGFDPDDPTCGAGTHAESGECVPNLPPAVCEDGTTAPEIQPDGTILCVGVGGAGCSTIRCESPTGGKVSLCGQLHDVETGLPLRRPDASGAVCEAVTDDPLDPCSLNIEFFDPLAFAANPTGTAPLAFDLKEINDCGHFRGINVMRPFNGFMAVATDDGITAPVHDEKRLTGIAFPVEMGETRKNLRAFVIDRSTDEAWTQSAGDPFPGGQTFVDRGVYGPVFRNPGPSAGDPSPGVVITSGGATKPADDYYFDDTDPETRSSVAAAQASTGANGMGLLVGSSLGQHSGAGGEPGGCEWQSELAASIPTVLFFRESFAHTTGNPEETCGE